VPWAIVAVAAILVVALAAGTGNGAPLDPRSADPNGAKALVLLLQQYGATVDITPTVPAPHADVQRVIVLVDGLRDRQRGDLLDWVDAGGVLVVADPSSALHRGPGPDGGAVTVVGAVGAGRCTIESLLHLDRVRVGQALAFPLAPGQAACFGDTEHAVVTADLMGAGTVVALGTGDVFENQSLGRDDNAALATALLAPDAAHHHVVILEPDRAGGGDRTLLQLVAPSVWLLLLQLALAFVVVVLWRGRRLGAPVLEPAPVEVAASELVVATSELARRARRPEQAAWWLRAGLRRELAARYGVPADAPPDLLDGVATARAGLAPGTVLAVLAGPPITDEAALVRLAAAVDAVRAALR
jgi:hypothetical protein